MGVALSIILTLVLTIANGYFSMSESALVAAKRAVLEHDADEGDKRAKVALELSGDSGQFLAAIQVAIPARLLPRGGPARVAHVKVCRRPEPTSRHQVR